MKKVILFICFCILGVILGCIVASLSVSLSKNGAFISWKMLDSKLKFKDIAAANSYEVWAKTSDDKLYVWRFKNANNSNCNDSSKCNQWVETPNITRYSPEFGEERSADFKDSCSFILTVLHDFPLQKEPPGKVVKCARAAFLWHEYSRVALYALMDDGTLWHWLYEERVFVPEIAIVCKGPLVGLIFGLIFFGTFMIIQSRIKQKLNNEQIV